ncbi:MAG: pyruvate, water dikinase [Desulfobacteraceae bacterium]|nr:pyruvate, water dikinase [Desulfobacteraceae bacterium]
MNWIKQKIDELFKKRNVHDSSRIEELRLDFKSRYHNFKLLLNSNNKSLEIMAEMEQALAGNKVFGMSFIRTNCTAVSVNILTMINNLNKLAPEKYSELYDRFGHIQKELDDLLHQKEIQIETRLVIPFEQITDNMSNSVGGKMAKLGEIKNKLNIKVPEGFAITAAAYEKFIQENDLQEEIDSITLASGADNLKELDIISAEIQHKIINADVFKKLDQAVTKEWEKLEKRAQKKIPLAIRSSALCEDSLDSSFAGQYRTELNVDRESYAQVYKEVISSKYSVQAMTYRLNKGFRDEDISMCTGCMAMVDSVAGGVVYTRNPVDTKDDSIFINSAWGLPKLVVDGSDSFDLIVVSREKEKSFKIKTQEIGTKKIKFVSSDEEGIETVAIPEDEQKIASIDEKTIYQLIELSIKIEDYYKIPQDIEWALAKDGTIYILQCRPLQQIELSATGDDTKGPESDPKADMSADLVIQGGITASPGTAYGPLYLATRDADILIFPEHSILVVEHARPRWAPLLNRAAAVISEHGGFAGHLANVAREFSVPAIMNLNKAMEKLTHGETVTVDADACSIYKGKKEAILKREKKVKKNLMKGSTVFKMLENSSDLIIPLNLLDPDSNNFKPSSCKTFHDITRFIHEKSVHEMFNFGKDNDFPEHSSKQLHFNAPLNWWILNLDDGFNKQIKGKYVRLKDIISEPMLAFWQGFIAVPWDGPPPVDSKGLMSIMFQSTMNPSLVPGIRSKYADRNYFMISKNYCSLNSRLGYHFSTMEALISERTSENYISFQFKGGAADFERRLKRVHFIQDILEAYDFNVEVTEDNLMARIDGYDREYLKTRLMILGYLSLHTRQIDMIMTNIKRVRYYRTKLGKDIDGML